MDRDAAREAVVVCDRLRRRAKVGRDPPRDIAGRVVDRLDLAGIRGIEEAGAAGEVVGDPGDVSVVVQHREELVHRVVAVLGPDHLALGGVELLDGQDPVLDVAVRDVLGTERVDHGRREPTLAVPVQPECVRHVRRGAVGQGGHQRSAEHVERGRDRRRLGIAAPVEHEIAPGALGLRGRIEGLEGAPHLIEGDTAADGHHIDRRRGLALEHRRVLLGLEHALEAIGEQHGLDRIGRAPEHIDVRGARIRHALLGVVLELDRRKAGAGLERAHHGRQPAEVVVARRNGVSVVVGVSRDGAEAEVVIARRDLAEAIGDADHVALGRGVVRQVERVALAVQVLGARDHDEVAIRRVLEVAHRAGQALRGLAELDHVRGRAVEARFAVAQGGAVGTPHGDRIGEADDVARRAGCVRATMAGIGDRRRVIVRGTDVAGVGDLGDVAVSVVGLVDLGLDARARVSFAAAPDGCAELGEHRGQRLGERSRCGEHLLGVDLAQGVLVLGPGKGAWRAGVEPFHHLRNQ